MYICIVKWIGELNPVWWLAEDSPWLSDDYSYTTGNSGYKAASIQKNTVQTVITTSTYTYICNIPTFCVVTEPFVYTKHFCGIWYVHRKTGRGTGATGAKKWTISSQGRHRVDRVLGFFSSRRYWDSPTPSPQASVPPPPFWFQGEGHTRLREKVWGGVPNSDEATNTVVI